MTLGFFCHQPVSETLAARSAALLRRHERDSGGGGGAAARFDLYSRRLPQKPALNCTRCGTVGCHRSARAGCCQLASGLEAGRRRQEESPSEAGCGRRLPRYVSIALVPFLKMSTDMSHFKEAYSSERTLDNWFRTQNRTPAVCRNVSTVTIQIFFFFLYFSNGQDSKDDSLSPHKPNARLSVNAAS